METNHHAGAEHAGKAEHNIMAVFAYLWILIIIPFLTDAKNDPFVKFHLKQGLALIIFDVVGWFAGVFLGWIPLIGWLLVLVWWAMSFIFAVMGIINVLNGKEAELPAIGKYARNFKF